MDFDIWDDAVQRARERQQQEAARRSGEAAAAAQAAAARQNQVEQATNEIVSLVDHFARLIAAQGWPHTQEITIGQASRSLLGPRSVKISVVVVPDAASSWHSLGDTQSRWESSPTPLFVTRNIRPIIADSIGVAQYENARAGSEEIVGLRAMLAHHKTDPSRAVSKMRDALADWIAAKHLPDR
jgi:hypothetical protein